MSNEKPYAEHETRIQLLEKNDIVQDQRLEKQGKEIDQILEIQNKTDVELKLMSKDLEMINGTTNRTEKKLDDLSRQRDDDHLLKPLDSVTWTKKQIIGTIIGVIVGTILAFLFSSVGM